MRAGWERAGAAVVAALMTACATGPAPVPAPAPATPSQPQPAPAAQEQEVSPYARPQEGTFWLPDKPVQQGPTAFGKVSAVRSAIVEKDGKRLELSVDRFALAAPLPTVPDRLPVYMTGVYHQEHHLEAPGWSYVSQYALASASQVHVTPPPGPDLAARAAAYLRQLNLLMPDSEQPVVGKSADGKFTMVAFYRHLGDLPVYGDKPACVAMDQDGTITFAQIRRRPLLEVSLYPTRSPAAAWNDLQGGQYSRPSLGFCQDAGSDLYGHLAEFRVTKVELGFWEHHVDTPRQTMLPYYIFRNADGIALYVPAIAPEWVQ